MLHGVCSTREGQFAQRLVLERTELVARTQEDIVTMEKQERATRKRRLGAKVDLKKYLGA